MYVVKNAERTEKRNFNKVFGNDILKYLAEIITNSNDSYDRLEQSENINSDVICPIYIHVTNNRSKKEVIVVDNAEGMDDADLIRNFQEYGADTSGGSTGKKVRGLFGQGASDVLFNASLNGKIAEICSFKDGIFYVCKFRWDGGDKVINPQRQKKSMSELRNLRDHYNIPKNGTIVRFGLPKDVAIPRNFVESINSFYMLRFILSKKNREIVLIEHTNDRLPKETKLEYRFPPSIDENILLSRGIDFQFEGDKVSGSLTLLRKPSDEGFGSLQILCYDGQKNVYDNTMFSYEKYPNADAVHGLLELDGASDIIRKKLNQRIPEEILTDTRDGFDKRHSFYKKLYSIVVPLLESVLDKLAREKPEKSVDLTDQREWRDVFKEINKYFQEELEEEIGGVESGVNPPPEGIRFAIPNIKITAGRKYSTKLLINGNLLPIGTVISLTSESSEIDISPMKIIVTSKDIDENNLAVKSISVSGLIVGTETVVTATSSMGHMSKLYVNVIDREIHYPKYGFEFVPNQVSLNTKDSLKTRLFINTEKFPIGTVVDFDCDRELGVLGRKSITLSEDHVVAGSIAMIENILVTLETQGQTEVKASAGSTVAVLSVDISNDNDNEDRGKGGFLNGLTIKAVSSHWQTFFDHRDGRINVNSENVVNKLYLGIVNTDNFKPDREQSRFLVDLCANEAARQLVKLKIGKGKIPGDDYEAVLDEIQKEKNKLLGIFIKILDRLIV